MSELKTIKLQGKDYVQVAERLRWFRENIKNGTIVTVPTFIDGTTGKYIQFKAEIYVDNKPVATAHSMKALNLPYAYEKTETAAIGRALGVYGIGIDAGIASYDEVREAIGGGDE